MYGFDKVADLLKCGPVELSPERQPDGRLSGEAAVERITTAMQMSTPLRFDWIHKRRDGTELPCEITLIRITLGASQPCSLASAISPSASATSKRLWPAKRRSAGSWRPAPRVFG